MRRGVRRTELLAALVVFLVALPVCVGVALTLGVPAELGLVTGAAGGLVASLARLGRWFRAVPVAVVQGMFAGIGVVLATGQVYALGDTAVPAGGLGKVAGLVGPAWRGDPVALSVGGATLVVSLLWGRWRRGARLVPAPLVALASAVAVTWALGLEVRRVEVGGLGDAVRLPGAAEFGRLAEVGVTGAVVALVLVTWAESSFTRVPHRVGVLVVAVGVLGVVGVVGMIPVAAVAALLLYVGCGLVPVREVRVLWRGHRGEVVVLVVTAVAVVVGNLFEGVLVGLALAVAKTAWEVSHVHVETEDRGDAGVVVRVLGHATFLRLPKLLDALHTLDVQHRDREIRLELGGLRHVDHACAAAIEGWAAARERRRSRDQGRIASSNPTS
ncbi:SulP family inorganic anion transporter [Streptomyces phaeoluteigriseus]|uniref:SulP family inorganic anion transporter n=1 Tax=Streptomyces phaeoluteigriseus TaxID=114686 RepID=A0ABY4Z352_9ACTN|nr:SulP family inorganic anion transporter [Streptomyces phaeoluteigriseus]USQ82767.1 SulP family inorganic anion transporter [Streptomyces phaeoluteigriseus]